MTFPVDHSNPFIQPITGHMGPQNPVADTDYVFLSSEGVAYRHYKDTTGVQFYDELIVSAGPQGLHGSQYTDGTAPLGGTGAQYPVYSAPVGRPSTTIGVVTIAGAAQVAFGSNEDYAATIAGDATNLEYTWGISSFNDVTLTNSKTDTVTLELGTQGVQGRQTIFCEVRDGTSKDSVRRGELSIEFV